MTAENRHDLRLAVLVLEAVRDGMGLVISVLGGDDALGRAKRDVEDVLEREKKKLEYETWLEQQVASSFVVTDGGET
jgi:hypothetical protein